VPRAEGGARRRRWRSTPESAASGFHPCTVSHVSQPSRQALPGRRPNPGCAPASSTSGGKVGTAERARAAEPAKPQKTRSSEKSTLASKVTSATPSGAPLSPPRQEPPWVDMCPDEVDRGARPVGSCAKSASTGATSRHGRSRPKGEGEVNQEFRLFVGVDLGSEMHQAYALDAKVATVGETVVHHNGAAIAAFADWLTTLSGGSPSTTAVAIETPRGAVVSTLIERGFAVFAINPKQLDRFRDRHTVAGAKDDRRDAFVLADSVRTDQHCFRRVRLDDPLIVQLREVGRADDDLSVELRRLASRLREQLHRYFPQVLQLSAAADEPWVWALLDKVSSPADAARLKPRAVDKFLREHRIRRVDGTEVVSTLQATALTTAPGVVEAARSHVALLLPRLRLVHSQRKQCAAEMERLMDALEAAPISVPEGKAEHRDVTILRSLPGVGRIVGATVLAEASWALADRDYSALRAHAGIAPVTQASGKRTTVIMRRACNERLRDALYHWSRVATQNDAPCRSYYDKLRARGHTHGRALRSVADHLLRILVAMLKSRELYNAKRGSLSLAAEAA
jgi:transposase